MAISPSLNNRHLVFTAAAAKPPLQPSGIEGSEKMFGKEDESDEGAEG